MLLTRDSIVSTNLIGTRLDSLYKDWNIVWWKR